jgi:hypothetical protein
MRWPGLKREWRFVAAWWAAVVLAAAHDGHADAGGPADSGSLAGTYRLVGVDEDGVPAVAQMENCTPSRFNGGAMSLTAAGTWRLAIDWNDEHGSHVLRDSGWVRQIRDDLAFDSERYRDGFRGTVRGAVVLLRYGFCGRGPGDVTFAFTH